MPALTTRRTPGVRFETRPPPPVDVLPRLDIAGFVGFAATGPVDVPVAVTDLASFTEVFGEPAELFWDEAIGAPRTAYLGSAVRAFFANGGTRCWVVRVAARSAAARMVLPLPALATIGADSRPTGVGLRARSVGSWADGVSAAAGLTATGVTATAVTLAADRTVRCAIRGRDTVQVGDLVRATYRVSATARLTGFFAVSGLAATATGVEVTGTDALWLGTAPLGAGERTGTARLESGTVQATAADGPGAGSGSGDVLLDLTVPLTEAPPPGTLVEVDLAGVGAAIVLVGAAPVAGSGGRIRVGGWLLRPAPAPTLDPARLATPDTAAVVTIEVRAAGAPGGPATIADLGLVPGHPRYVGDLPTDEQLYASLPTADEPRPPSVPPLWPETASPRFPLAGPAGPARVLYPIGLDLLDGWTYLPARTGAGRALERDGLGVFGADLFLDPELAGAGTSSLLASAEFLRDQSDRPRPLLGVHALLGVDEVTVVAVPDAVRTGWLPAEPAAAPTPPVHEPYVPLVECPRPPDADFGDSATAALVPPVLSAAPVDGVGTVRLSWGWIRPGATEVRFVLQEIAGAPPSWSRAVDVHSGPERGWELYGRPPGTYFYRVRVEARVGTVLASSDWSAGIAVTVGGGEAWRSVASSAYVDDTLVAVQRATVRLCAARGDMIAVLATPAHYRDKDAAAHAARLRGPGIAGAVPVLAGDERALSFGALYHPWLVTTEPARPGEVDTLPPDGAVAGVFAARTASRGAWVAPANVPLIDVRALVPAPAVGTRGLDAFVNTVDSQPRGFVALSADTLSADPDLRQVTTRRLLALLRRVALRVGPTYVFEPNGPTLRRGVRRRFEAILAELLTRGAFAGAGRVDSYQVSTPIGAEDELVVELRVAPAVPLRFLLVRLRHAGTGEPAVEGA